jgi:hypothetical protein
MNKSYEANVQMIVTRTVVIEAENLDEAKNEALKEATSLVGALSSEILEIKELEDA